MSQTVVLNVKMSCQGCAGAVQRVLGKMEGVESFDIDMKEQKVTVKGNVQPQVVFEAVSKTGKKTAFWEAQAPPTEPQVKPTEEAPAQPEQKPAEAAPAKSEEKPTDSAPASSKDKPAEAAAPASSEDKPAEAAAPANSEVKPAEAVAAA